MYGFSALKLSFQLGIDLHWQVLGGREGKKERKQPLGLQVRLRGPLAFPPPPPFPIHLLPGGVKVKQESVSLSFTSSSEITVQPCLFCAGCPCSFSPPSCWGCSPFSSAHIRSIFRPDLICRRQRASETQKCEAGLAGGSCGQDDLGTNSPWVSVFLIPKPENPDCSHSCIWTIAVHLT